MSGGRTVDAGRASGTRKARGIAASCMSASVIDDSAWWIASFTGSQRPRTGHRPWDSHSVSEPSTQAASAIGPSMAAITSATGMAASGRSSR